MKQSASMKSRAAADAAFERVRQFVLDEMNVRVPEPRPKASKPLGWSDWNRQKKMERDIRSIANWQQIRRAILERDGFVCRICGVDPCEAQMHVHHVDWDRKNNAHRNLVTLCRDCHRSIHAHGYRPDGEGNEPWGNRGQR